MILRTRGGLVSNTEATPLKESAVAKRGLIEGAARMFCGEATVPVYRLSQGTQNFASFRIIGSTTVPPLFNPKEEVDADTPLEVRKRWKCIDSIS